ncbi:hypothetical protein V5279_14870 [Bradyrhizobium sp. 26S5]|uniref:hypothetical protein n=1 Tax=Bradyrhizobium sp. 26S5 TaxID=3139729 RepID=UPI0030D0D193
MLSREASLDNSPIDLSWLGRGKSTLPPPYISSAPYVSPAPERRSEAATLAEAAMNAVAAALETATEVLEEPPTMADAPQPMMRPPVLDLDTIQRRYPLLRNAL